MIADFTITVYYRETPRAVQVKIHDNVAALRSAATQRARVWKGRKKKHIPEPERAVGLCEKFYWDKDPVCAIVRLAPPHIGIGVVSHELCHAATWIREIEHQFVDTPLTGENDEEFCWVLGELVRCTVLKMYEKGVWV